MNDTAIFQFPEVTQGTITAVSFTNEKHGNVDVLAMDLTLTREASNDQLLLLHPQLREAFYWNAAEDGKAQDRLPDVIAVLPDLKFPQLNGSTQTWLFGGKAGYRAKGYRFVQDYGMGEEAGSNVDLSECSVGNVSFELKPNGITVLKWGVRCVGEAQLTERVRAFMPLQIGKSVNFQLIAPAVMEFVKGKGPKTPPPNPDQQQLQEDGDKGGGDDTAAGGEGSEGGNQLEAGSPEAAFVNAVRDGSESEAHDGGAATLP
jgi:hypothetical protein